MRTFHTEDDSRVLVLEDDGLDSIPWFRKRLPRCTLVRNPLVAIEALRGRSDWEWVFLDYDTPCPEGLKGSHVAHELIEMGFNGKVLVHSHNHFGAKMIGHILRVAGIRNAVCEFGSFEISTRGLVEISVTVALGENRFDLGEI